MAIYSLCTTPVSRSAGVSAVAKAAYRAGERLIDQLSSQICDYTRKAGVVFKEIFCPKDLTIERQDLWNLAEEAEKRKDARTAREIRIALPHELSEKERENLARDFAQELVKRYGVAVDLCIHLPDKQGDKRNYHAHLLLTTRQLTLEGFSEKSDLEKCDKDLKKLGKLSTKKQLIEIRESWENLCNLALERQGLEERISAKSNKARGIEQEPTIHLGPAVTAMERRGIETYLGTWNRIITKLNLSHVIQEKIYRMERVYKVLTDRITELKNELKKGISQALQPKQKSQEESLSIDKILTRVHKMSDDNREFTKQDLSVENLLNDQKEHQEELDKNAEGRHKLSVEALLNHRESYREKGLNRDNGGLEL